MALRLLLLLWIAACIAFAFLRAPLVSGLGETTRVIYFHVPCAWICWETSIARTTPAPRPRA